MREYTVKKVTVFRVVTFSAKRSAKYILGIYKILNITNSTNLKLLCGISIRINKFPLSKFRHR